MPLEPTEILVKEFATGAGATAITVDGSAASTNFFISVSASATYFIRSLHFEIQDTKSYEPDEFADTGGSLSAGIAIKVLSSDLSELNDLTGGDPIKDNSHLLRFFDEVNLGNLTNTTNAVLTGDYLFERHHGQPLKLTTGQRLNIAINDDLTGLVDFKIVARGNKQSY